MDVWLFTAGATFVIALTTAWMCSRLEMEKVLPKTQTDLKF